MSLESFFDDSSWGSVVEKQTRLRIKLAIYAYAYEIENQSLISDEEYDKMSLEVDTSIKTSNRKMDNFFKKHFDPSTGVWVRKHPEIRKLSYLYGKYYKESAK